MPKKMTKAEALKDFRQIIKPFIKKAMLLQQERLGITGQTHFAKKGQLLLNNTKTGDNLSNEQFSRHSVRQMQTKTFMLRSENHGII